MLLIYLSQFSKRLLEESKMTVEIGALLSKDFGQKALETLIDFEVVKSVSVET